MTEGTVLSSIGDCPGATITEIVFSLDRSEISASRLQTFPISDVLTVQATGIFLQGQTWTKSSLLAATPSTTTANSLKATSTSTPSSIESNYVPSAEATSHNRRSIIIGASIGAVFGASILLWLGFFLLRRHRRKHRAKPSTEELHEYNEAGCLKPELEGNSPPRVCTTKAELDSLATRAELDGMNGQNGGAGFYVQKPELEGSPGLEGAWGVYVLKKYELETRTRPKSM